MNKKINERKNIIISLKSNSGEPKKGIEKRIEFLKGMTILNLILILISGGILALSIISEFFNYEIYKWQKSGLIVILSLNFIMNLPNQLYELKLLKDLKKISSKSEFDGIDKLNYELKSIIKKSNYGFKNNWLIIILALGIMIMGIWQTGLDEKNPYWDSMKLPILIFYGIIISGFIVKNRKLNENIEKTARYCN